MGGGGEGGMRPVPARSPTWLGARVGIVSVPLSRTDVRRVVFFERRTVHGQCPSGTCNDERLRGHVGFAIQAATTGNLPEHQLECSCLHVLSSALT
jgi:hypothetical protein